MQDNSSYTMPDLYEALSSGASFTLQFNCKEEANIFRQKIATHKFRVEKELKAMGVIPHMTLSMTYDMDTDIATFFLQEPVDRELQTYTVLEMIPPPAS